MAASTGTEALFALQDLLRPTDGLPTELYLRQTPSRPAAAPEQTITLPHGATLSTDTFFNAFYMAWWQSVAGLCQPVLSVRLLGRAQVRILQDAGRGIAKVLVADLTSDGMAPQLLQPDLQPPGTDGANRLYVEVEALGQCRMFALDWRTSQPPVRSSTLSVGLCTFNQEAHLTRTLTRLTALADALPALQRIHLVNQGARFASPELQELCRHPKLRLIEQRNLGGCGGFTRTLVEEMAADAPASHHLLMDDDILLDERLITRSLQFLDHAQEDIALGAGMFDRLRPAIMHEAGAWLLPANRIEPFCHDVNLAEPAQLWRFNARVRTDYNAWWFCILPLAVVARIGLPAPVFIRGDDFEYGQRMAEAGCATITLPGLGIWHDPFYAKPTSWQDYYDLRNRLIFAATHPAKVRQLSLAHVAGVAVQAALTHNYPSARLRLMAVEDYLAGPEPVFADPEALHGRVMSLGRQDAPEKLGAEWADTPVAAPGPARPAETGPLIWHMTRSLLRTGFWPKARGEAVVMDIDATPMNVAGRTYVLTNTLRSYHLRFRPERRKLWSILWQTLRLARRYRREVAAADAKWLAAIPAYRRPNWWRANFTRPD